MNKTWGVLLVLSLAACSAGEDKAVQACETVFAALEASLPTEHQEKTKLESKEIQSGKVHLLVHGPNGNGDMIFTDINCVFKLDRQPTEKIATLKLSEIEIGKFPESVWSIDSNLKSQGNKTVTEWLQEKGLNAILPQDTKLTLAE